MNAKYGFSLLLVAFGALMFFAGLCAPDSLRVAGFFGPAVPAKSKPAPAVPAAAAPAAPPAGAVAKADPILLESLLVPVPAPDKRLYALQAGQFVSDDLAAALGARLKQQQLPFEHLIKVVDQGGKIWFIVPVGPYASLDAARAARAQVALKMGIDAALPAILLPPAAKS